MQVWAFFKNSRRRSSSFNTDRVNKFYETVQNAKRFFLHYGDVTDAINVTKIIEMVKPDEIYNLSAQSHVAISF